MGMVDLTIPGGVIKDETESAVSGRIIDCNRIRFVDGRPQSIGGWYAIPNLSFEGVARGMHKWPDTTGIPLIGFGSHTHLYLWHRNDGIRDITPKVATGVALPSDPIEVFDGNLIAEITITAHTLVVGDRILIEGLTDVASIDFNREWLVVTVKDANTIKVELDAEAGADAAGGGASGTYDQFLASGSVDAKFGTGYGAGGYGVGGYGTAREPSETGLILPRQWTIDNYGSVMLAMANKTALYQYDPSSIYPGPVATKVANSPEGTAMFVTNERFPFVLNADGVAMKVRWPHNDDITDWTGTENNRADERQLQGGSFLIGGIRMQNGVNLIFSDTDCFNAQWIGGQNVYRIDSIGSGCGLVSPAAITKRGGRCYWMSAGDFWMYDGTLQTIPRSSEIKDYVFGFLAYEGQDAEFGMNITQQYKCFAAYSAQYQEVWFFYPGRASKEPDRYAIVNLRTFDWAIGRLTRTAMIQRQERDARPVMAGLDGKLYSHDDGLTVEEGGGIGSTLSVARVDIQDGNKMVEIFGFVPDFKDLVGSVEVQVDAFEKPASKTPHDTGSVTILPDTELEDLRVSGRQISLHMTLVGEESYFRMGQPQVDISTRRGRTRR
jgi:hypothetical protein